MITITDYRTAVAALKHPALEQALYDAGAKVMKDVLLTLHGDTHRKRRVAEYAVFKRDFFRRYETQTFPNALAPILDEAVRTHGACLVDLSYRVVMNLTADFAGIDRSDTREETECLLGLIKTFSAGATLAHAERDPAVVNAEVEAAMATLDQRFLNPSIARRRKLIDEAAELPNDILTILLTRPDLGLGPDELRREIAFYLQAGAHSTANATVHAVDACLRLIEDGATTRAALLEDASRLQRCVHETLRLHPASPIALRRARTDCEIDALNVQAGDLISVDIAAANRDPDVFGPQADAFDPDRVLPPRVRLWGLSFGHGIHACMGRDLDGGVPRTDDSSRAEQLGIVTLLVRAYLEQGANRIEADPPTGDSSTSRNVFGRYPVTFSREAA